TQHMGSAAEPEHGLTATGMPYNRRIQSSCAQPVHILQWPPAAGNNNQIGVTKVAGFGHELHIDAGFDTQRIGVGEVKRAWHGQHPYAQLRVSLRTRTDR